MVSLGSVNFYKNMYEANYELCDVKVVGPVIYYIHEIQIEINMNKYNMLKLIINDTQDKQIVHHVDPERTTSAMRTTRTRCG